MKLDEVVQDFISSESFFGLIIGGRKGIGKDYAAQKYFSSDHWHTGNFTEKGLFKILKLYPAEVHIFADCEGIFRPKSFSLLKAGLDQKSERRIKWDTNNGEESFVFQGRMVFLTNQMNPGPHMEALQSRCFVYHFEPTKEEFEDAISKIAPDTFSKEVFELLRKLGCADDYRKIKQAIEVASRHKDDWQHRVEILFGDKSLNRIIHELKETGLPASSACREFMFRTGKSEATFWRLWRKFTVNDSKGVSVK